MTVRSIVLVALAALFAAACSTPQAPRTAVASDALDRVVVAPMNVSVSAPAELEGQMDVIWDGLLGYFRTEDRLVAVLSPISAERLWLEANSGLAGSDRTAALRTASARFARGLAKHRDYDVLVVPSLVLRPARMHGRMATWDGVSRHVPNADDVIGTGIMNAQMSTDTAHVLGLRGKIAAASLHVALYRPDGSLLREGLGGIDLIQEAQLDGSGHWGFEARANPFADERNLREGVEIAFERPLWSLARR